MVQSVLRFCTLDVRFGKDSLYYVLICKTPEHILSCSDCDCKHEGSVQHKTMTRSRHAEGWKRVVLSIGAERLTPSEENKLTEITDATLSSRNNKATVFIF